VVGCQPYALATFTPRKYSLTFIGIAIKPPNLHVQNLVKSLPVSLCM